jgi:molybdenum cofactor guanylyltransferase
VGTQIGVPISLLKMLNLERRKMDRMLPGVSGVILAGGQSRRMGQNKAFLDFGGMPLIAHVIERLRAICTETMIIADDVDAYARFDLRVVADVFPGKGSLGGIYTGLQSAHEEHILAVACDMPFLNEALLHHLTLFASRYDVIVPRARSPLGKPSHLAMEAILWDLQPLHAVYAKSCLAAMQKHIGAGHLQIVRIFEDLRIHIVEPTEVDRFDPMHKSFLNVNTPEEWTIAKSFAGPNN